jgi:hypothetical protein
MTGLLTLAWYGGTTMILLASALNLAGLFAVARSAGRGDGDLESVGFTGVIGSAVVPVLRFGVVTLPTWGGLWLAESLHSQLLGWASIALAFVWAPIAFLGAAAGTELLRLLNPFAVLGTFVRIGADAGQLALFLLGLSGLGSVLTLLALRANALPVPFLSTLLGAALLLYTPFVAAHVTGLLLLLHPEPFGWDNLSLQPALGKTGPRGVAPPLAEARARPAHLMPIELPDAPRPEELGSASPLTPSGVEVPASNEGPGAPTPGGNQRRPLDSARDDRGAKPVPVRSAPGSEAPPSGQPAGGPRTQGNERAGNLFDAGGAHAPFTGAVAVPRRTELSAEALPSLAAHARDLVLHAMKSGDAVLALETFRATPELAAALSLAELSWVGRAAASQGDDASAELALRAACEAAGDPAALGGAHVYLAKLLDERLGRGAEARALLEKVQRDFPGTPGAAFASGWLARKAGTGG